MPEALALIAGGIALPAAGAALCAVAIGVIDAWWSTR